MGKIILKVANLVPGVFILSFNFSSSAPFGPETVISTTQDLDLRVQIEISHVMRILQDSGEIDKIQRGKLAGFIEGLAKRTILAEREVKSQCGEHAILENEKDKLVKLLKKSGVFAYLRSLVELYEWLLDPDESKSVEVTDEELEQLGLPVNLADRTVKDSVRTHYGRWLRILNVAENPKVEEFKSTVMPALGFKDDKHFAKSVAYLFCVLSNIGHNFPVDMISFSAENDVIEALESWQIKDSTFLNTARAFYRLVRLPRSTTTTLPRPQSWMRN